MKAFGVGDAEVLTGDDESEVVSNLFISSVVIFFCVLLIYGFVWRVFCFFLFVELVFFLV